MSDYLPQDLIVEILIKLPVKSLIRFKSVSKGWRSIISDPQFAKLQYKQRPANRRLLLNSWLIDSPEFLKSINLDQAVSSFAEDMRRVVSPFKDFKLEVNLVGSSNGLVCLTASLSSIGLYIWNPTTGMLQKLPHPSFSKERKELGIEYSGFGYLSATDDYKVVISDLSNVEIFSLRTRVCKRIQSHHRIHPICFYRRSFNRNHQTGVVLNEALHWLTDHVNGQGRSILAFDLATDQFRTMPLPNVCCEMDSLDICVSRGCLYLFRCKYVGKYYLDSVQLWIMSEYGVPDSWTKLYNYSLPDELGGVIGIADLKLILVTEASTVVKKLGSSDVSELVRLHEEGNHVVNPRYSLRREYIAIEVYEESLLWIHDIEGQKDSN